jgi:hypothetical protein
MIAAYVLIFVHLGGSILSPIVTVQPIYFHTKQHCDAAALEFNNGLPQPRRGDGERRSIGAICFATGAPQRSEE